MNRPQLIAVRISGVLYKKSAGVMAKSMRAAAHRGDWGRVDAIAAALATADRCLLCGRQLDASGAADAHRYVGPDCAQKTVPWLADVIARLTTPAPLAPTPKDAA